MKVEIYQFQILNISEQYVYALCKSDIKQSNPTIEQGKFNSWLGPRMQYFFRNSLGTVTWNSFKVQSH